MFSHQVLSWLQSRFSDIINILCGPCPDKKGADRQKYYRIRKRYVVKELHSQKHLYESMASTQNLLKVVPRDSLFDLFERVHIEGGKHLGRDRLFLYWNNVIADSPRKLFKFIWIPVLSVSCRSVRNSWRVLWLNLSERQTLLPEVR